MRITGYFFSLVTTLFCIFLVCEFGLKLYMPETYRGYLVEENKDQIKWAIGPYEPSQPIEGFNTPIELNKPDNTIRIISAGASATEGWLSAKAVFKKYGQKMEPESISSYSRVVEFDLNQISDSSSKKVEVINLGIAAYNVTDVIRMLKDSMKLSPDLFLIHISLNETWTAERYNWSGRLNTAIPYLFTELGYQVFTDTRAKWRTLAPKTASFSPVALGRGRTKPIVPEPPGRAEGLEEKLTNYNKQLELLGNFLNSANIPVLFLVPTQNLYDFQPFGSMAKTGSSAQELEDLNNLLIAALAKPGLAAKQDYLNILELDDGVAEAHFQLGRIHSEEGSIETARKHLWMANDRDLILKRPPSIFHEATRSFIDQHEFPSLDVMKFFESLSLNGLVGNNLLYDDVHPDRRSQFELGTRIAESIIDLNLLPSENYIGDLQSLPTFEDYNKWTGYNNESNGRTSYLRGAHNFYAFNRYASRMRWDPRPENFLAPVIDYLDVANRYAPSDQSHLLSAQLNLFLGQRENTRRAIKAMGCGASTDRSAQVYSVMNRAGKRIFGKANPELLSELQQILVSEGCKQ